MIPHNGNQNLDRKNFMEQTSALDILKKISNFFKFLT